MGGRALGPRPAPGLVKLEPLTDLGCGTLSEPLGIRLALPAGAYLPLRGSNDSLRGGGADSHF